MRISGRCYYASVKRESLLHVRHVAADKEGRRLPVFTKRRVGITRPRNDAGMLPR